MKYAADFRQIARDCLKGKWGIAVLAGMLAMLMGGVSSNGPEVTFQYNNNGATINLEIADQTIYSTTQGIAPELRGILIGGAVYIIIISLVMAVAYFILGSIIKVGYSKFNLDLVDRSKEPEVGTMFGYFRSWKTLAVAELLQTIYIILWSFLLVIPGIMASYSYAMTGFILAENPNMDPGEAISRSKEMMTGNRWRLFCLHLSFIGWSILSTLILGIGELWLTPYRQAANAAFYREVSGTETVKSDVPEYPFLDSDYELQ